MLHFQKHRALSREIVKGKSEIVSEEIMASNSLLVVTRSRVAACENLETYSGGPKARENC